MIAAAVLLVSVLALGGCASGPPPATPQPLPAPQAQPSTPQPPGPQPPPEAPPIPVVPGPETPKPEFAVTTEVYKRTFDEIRTVIDELNTHIAKREYDGWLEHLTENYVRETSKPEYLDKWKEDPELKRRNIVLKTLRDFFNYRVVPTRSNVKLDEIQFMDDAHVHAFTVLRGEKYLLYYLVRTEDGWKVDFY